MTNHISVESLSVISHDSIPVVTTELLANLYDTDVDNIKKNFSRNALRFTEGKHYFKLTGDELRSFKHKVTNCPLVKIAGNVRHLMLWTERGAARHAKMLETDQAWEVFEKLEDCYFSQKEKSPAHPIHRYQPPAFRYLIRLTYKDVVTGQEETFRGGANSPDEIIQGTAKRFGMYVTEMIVMPANAYC
ncbi:ORF6N domain-containing protein [Salmonella enterica]|nr:ORF6N domain-containing protein [Salmonella enterica]EAX3609319.1 ORF6N domain-containing protein [Salmonella enterica]EGW6282863.1 ORF6N domain-containing protein [Salmonella enterica]EGX3935275.1 ORF6N domain-containing protein [Salmonella enterica]